MNKPALILVLGDQLTLGCAALRNARPGTDTIIMVEVREEASYVRHNHHKIALIFSAMRQCGFTVIYFQYAEGRASLFDAVEEGLSQCDARVLRYCEPGEFRLLTELQSWQLSVPVPVPVELR